MAPTARSLRRPSAKPRRRARRPAVLATAALACSGVFAGCTENVSSGLGGAPSNTGLVPGEDFTLRTPPGTQVLQASGPVDAAMLMSQTLFERADTVVLADLQHQDAASRLATDLGAPTLLSPASTAPADNEPPSATKPAGTTASPGPGNAGTTAPLTSTGLPSPARKTPTSAPQVLEELNRLRPSTILVAGANAKTLAEQADAAVIEIDEQNPQDTDRLPSTEPIALDGDLAVLTTSRSVLAAQATAEAAGATPVTVPGGDPRAAESAKALRSTDGPVIGVGAQFVDTDTLAQRMHTVRTAEQLPGGGQVVFPGRMMVALYGHPGAPVLGVLGEQDLEATIARAREHASWYQADSDVPVVPTLEIIATVAAAGPGEDGDYSDEYPASQFEPYVRRAADEDVYVLLDLQPGRDRLIDQAKQYESLLKQPHVGLAIDPEWKLHGDQTPLRQIGHIDAAEINEVADWLADLTAGNDLPQKLLVLHQFQLGMLPDRNRIDTGRDELSYLVHADGQGTQGMKQATWQALHHEPPPNVWWGWKNFYDEDSPTLPPQQTVQVQPRPNLVTYQ